MRLYVHCGRVEYNKNSAGKLMSLQMIRGHINGTSMRPWQWMVVAMVGAFLHLRAPLTALKDD